MQILCFLKATAGFKEFSFPLKVSKLPFIIPWPGTRRPKVSKTVKQWSFNILHSCRWDKRRFPRSLKTQGHVLLAYLYLWKHSSIECKNKISSCPYCCEDFACCCSWNAIIPGWGFDSYNNKENIDINMTLQDNLTRKFIISYTSIDERHQPKSQEINHEHSLWEKL